MFLEFFGKISKKSGKIRKILEKHFENVFENFQKNIFFRQIFFYSKLFSGNILRVHVDVFVTF